MAVQQISRITHRRGLRIDLPDPLNDAEFGWAEDTRELFIGEGPFFGRNTQILTQHTPSSLPPYTYLDKIEIDTSNTILNPIPGDNSIETSARTFPEAITGFDPFGLPGTELESNANFPTIRSYQQKFDDIVSVKDYGAVGDGLVDDTGAIFRAIFDIYNQTTSPFVADVDASTLDDTAKFRALYFPAGTYRVTQFIALYPFSTLFGDGKTKTKIFLDFTGPATSLNRAVARTVDSLGQAGSNIGVDLGGGAATFTPQNIVVRGISFESNTAQTELFSNKDIVRIDRAKNVRFEDCEVAGTWTSSDGVVGGSRAVVIENLGEPLLIPQNISFLSCNFRGTAFAFNMVEQARNIYAFNSRFETHRTAVKIGTDAAIDGVPSFEGDTDLFRVSHSRFGGDISEPDLGILISGFEVRTTSGRGNISTYNVYTGVYSGATGEAAVFFDNLAKSCVSIGDTFPDMTDPEDCVDKATNPRVQNIAVPNENVVMNAQDLFQIPFGFCGNILIDGDLTVTGDIILGGSIISAGAPFSATAIGFQVIETVDYVDGNVIFYEYGMRLGSPLTATYRVGTLMIVHNASYDSGTGALLGDPTVIDFTDNFNELNGPFADPPVTLTASLDNPGDFVKITVTVGGATTTPTVVGVVRVQKV